MQAGSWIGNQRSSGREAFCFKRRTPSEVNKVHVIIILPECSPRGEPAQKKAFFRIDVHSCSSSHSAFDLLQNLLHELGSQAADLQNSMSLS